MVEPTSCRQCSPGQPKGRAGCLKRARPDLCGGRRVTGVPTANRETGAVPFSEPDPGVVPLGGRRAGAASRSARCSTRRRRTGRFTWWRTRRSLLSEAIQQPVASAALLPRLELPGPDELRHAGVDRVVEKVLQFTPEPGHNPARRMRGFDLAFGVDRRVGAASRWSTSSTLRWDSPSSRKQPDRGRARCGPGLRRLRAARPPAGRARRRAVRSVPSSSPRRARVADAGTYPGWAPSCRCPASSRSCRRP